RQCDMFWGITLRIKLERNCSIDGGVLAVRMKVHAETDFGTGLQKDAGAFFEFMTVVADAVRLQIRLAALRVNGGRAGVMKRLVSFDGLYLDCLHITVFGQA